MHHDHPESLHPHDDPEWSPAHTGHDHYQDIVEGISQGCPAEFWMIEGTHSGVE